jgi:hypothetical protein
MADLPRKILLITAQRTVNQYDGKVRVFFKFTCTHCQTRCTFRQPSILYGHGTCFKCGKSTTVNSGGYLLVIAKNVEPVYTLEDWQHMPCDTDPIEKFYS